MSTGKVRPRKPEPDELGVNLALLDWQQSGDGPGCLEVAFPVVPDWKPGDWVLMRVSGDPDSRVLVYDRNEWVCFLDGVSKGEFDAALT